MILTLTLFLALAPQDRPRTGIAAWDSVQPVKDLAARDGWAALAGTAGSFKGDAVVTNGKVTIVARKQGAAVELYGASASRARLVLQAAPGDPAARLASVALVENGRGAAALEVGFKTAKGAEVSARFRLKRGDVSVEVEPRAARGLRVEAPGRLAVLPDFFADDILVDAARIPVETAELPSENFLLHMVGKGDAIVMCVFENREQDVRVTLSGAGEGRVIGGSEIEFGQKKKIWVGLIEGSQVWHAAEVKPADAGKVLALDWKMPYAAVWRADFTRADELTHTWEVLLQEKEGAGYLKPSWMTGTYEQVGQDRKRWTGSLMYSILYPCWSDPAGKGYVQPLKNRWVTYSGPLVVYPANRVPQTPLEAFTVVDLVRNTLGAGPCEYLLDLESQKAERKGRATCSVRDELKMIYEKGEQKRRRADVERFLQQGIDFVRHIRGRIENYLELARGLKDYLAEQKKAHPDLAESIGQLEKILREVDGHLGDRKEKIRTPDEVVAMTEEFRKSLLDYEGPDAVERVKKYSDALTEIGGNQDDLVARLRWVVKNLRQRAAVLMTRNPKIAPVAEEIRVRTQKALKNPAIHEENRQ